MDDRKVPWWRKALSFALDGIRSGFGLFSKPQKENSVDEPEIVSARADVPEEESRLIEHSPMVEEIAEIAREAEPVSRADVSPVPQAEAAVAYIAETVEPEPPATIEAASEAEPVAAINEAAESEGDLEFLPELAVPAPEPEAEIEIETAVETIAVIDPPAEHAPDPAVEAPAREVEAETESAMEVAAIGQDEVPAEALPEEPVGESPVLAEILEEPAIEAERAPQVEVTNEPELLTAEPVAVVVTAVTETENELSQFLEASTEIEEQPAELGLDSGSESALPQEQPQIAEREATVELSADEELVQEPVGDVPEPVEHVAEAEPVAKTECAPEPVIIEEAFPTEDSVPEPAVSYLELSEPVLEEVTAEAPVQFEVVEEHFAEAISPFPEAIPEIEQAAEEVAEQDPETVDESMELNEPIPEQAAEPIEAGETEAVAVPVAATAASEAAANQEVPGAATERILPTEQAEVDQPEPEPVAAVATTPSTPHKPFIKLESRDNEADLSPFSVIVSQVYDGPLDLLLDLIRKQDIDIYDIPIARITAQFLAYVNQLKATDVDVAGEFIYTASLLIHIKSKMLLPRAPSGQDDAAEDPRRELVERLLEHERFKNAAQMLQQKQMLEAASWTNPGMREFKDDTSADPEIAADTVDLVRIFRDILERARNRPVINVEEDSVTVGQMIQFLARRLTMEDKPVALRRLLSQTRSERALIAMFLALLELVRLQAILLRQDLAFSEIFIKKHTGFEAVMNEGAASARDDWR